MEKNTENVSCKTCGRKDLPLHFNRQCPECYPIKKYKVWIEVEEYNPKTDEYSKGLQLDAGEFETEKEANDYAVKMFEAV